MYPIQPNSSLLYYAIQLISTLLFNPTLFSYFLLNPIQILPFSYLLFFLFSSTQSNSIQFLIYFKSLLQNSTNLSKPNPILLFTSTLYPKPNLLHRFIVLNRNKIYFLPKHLRVQLKVLIN